MRTMFRTKEKTSLRESKSLPVPRKMLPATSLEVPVRSAIAPELIPPSPLVKLIAPLVAYAAVPVLNESVPELPLALIPAKTDTLPPPPTLLVPA